MGLPEFLTSSCVSQMIIIIALFWNGNHIGGGGGE
jgi:hypothetical protein